MPKDPFRNFSTYKIDPLTEVRNAGIVTNGRVFWVSSTGDSDHRSRTEDLGNSEVKVSLQAAIDASVSDRNDYVLVIPTDGGTARRLGTAVDVNEDRLHILGVGSKPRNQSYNGLTFDGFAVAVGNDTELVNVTGAGVEMGGLRFLGTSGTDATGTITATFRAGTASSGTPHDLWLHDMHIENNNAAAAGGTAPLFEVTGDVATGIRGIRVERSWIGNFSWAPTPVVNFVGTAGPSRAEFVDVTFVMDAQVVGDRFVTVGTGVSEYTLFEQCKFINVEAGTGLTSGITGAVLVDNPVILSYCTMANVTAFGTDTELLVVPMQSGTAGAGLHNPGIAFVGSAGISAA